MIYKAIPITPGSDGYDQDQKCSRLWALCTRQALFKMRNAKRSYGERFDSLGARSSSFRADRD